MSNCPKCHTPIDAATAVDMSDDLPKAGDLAVCWCCGLVMKFDGPIPLPRTLTTEEEWTVLQSPDVMDALIRFALSKKASIQ